MSIRRRSGNNVRDALDVVRFVWSHPSNKGKRAEVLRRSFLYQARGLLFKEPTIVPLGTRSRIFAYPHRGTSGLVYANPLEWREIAVWQRTLKPGDLFVDVGANVGSYTIWAIEQGARVIAIEPDPSYANCLRENLALNGYEAEIIEAAVTDARGRGLMTADQGVTNHLIPKPQMQHSVNTREVETTTLDDILGDRIVAGVKLDVEGAESLVLRGARRALTEHRIRLLQMEWNSFIVTDERRNETASWLEELGYEFFLPGDHDEEIPVRTPGPTRDVFARPSRS